MVVKKIDWVFRWSVRVFFTNPKPVSTTTELPRRRPGSLTNVQRATVYTITADPISDDQRGFPDFFWNVSPQTSRSRDAIHKDDKDLPSYEEVMQMEMRQQVVGLPAPIAALPATQAISTNDSTSTTTAERVAPVSVVPIVATASV